MQRFPQKAHLAKVKAGVETSGQLSQNGSVHVSLDDDRTHLLALERPPTPEQLLIARQEADLAHRLVAKLSDRRRTVVTRRFGLLGQPAATLKQIGQDLGITVAGVRMHVNAAMEELRRLAQMMPPVSDSDRAVLLRAAKQQTQRDEARKDVLARRRRASQCRQEDLQVLTSSQSWTRVEHRLAATTFRKRRLSEASAILRDLCEIAVRVDRPEVFAERLADLQWRYRLEAEFVARVLRGHRSIIRLNGRAGGPAGRPAAAVRSAG